MLDSIITSKTRLKILMKFFLNPRTSSYLRKLSSEFQDSTNGIRVELNRLTKAGLLISKSSGRTLQYSANRDHDLFDEISSLVKKYAGIDKIIDKLLKKLGHIKSAYVIGDYARGIDSGLIDILIIGKVDIDALNRIIDKRSLEISRKIRPLVLGNSELQKLWDQLQMDQALLIWGDPIKKDRKN